MALEYQFRPLTKFPVEKTAKRKRSQFSAEWRKTLLELEVELRALQARNVVFQVDVIEGDLRRDGMLRADAKVRSPAVVLSFDSKHGPLSYPCDQFSEWQDNVRAIALSLKALRAVDRYGVTRRAEQYTGWAALPDKSGMQSRDDALRVIWSIAERIAGEPIDDAIRRAELLTHPDRGGNRQDFERVQQARKVLLGA